MTVSAVAKMSSRKLKSALAAGEAGVIGALIIISVIFQSINSAFLSQQDVLAILTALTFIGIIGVGQAILLVSGEFDLSVGSVAGLCAIVSGKLMTAGGLPVPVAIALALLTGIAIGLVNGFVVVRLGVPAFIQTLGMLFVGQGLIQLVSGGYPVYPLPESVVSFGQQRVLFGLGWSFVILVLVAIAGDFAMRRTVVGRNTYTIGGNAEVARIVGINVARYRIAAFTLVGFMSAVAGLLVMASLSSATTSIGQGWELSVIAGVVVGGVSLFGGVGTVVGAVAGVLLLQVVQSGLVVTGLSPNWQNVAVGVIMVAAVGFDIARRRFSAGRHTAKVPPRTASGGGGNQPAPEVETDRSDRSTVSS